MAAPSSSTIAAQAAEWIVRLSCDDAAERVAARRDFDAWKAADRRHAAAAAGMERLLLQVESVRANGAGEPGSAALAAALDARGKRGRLKTYAAAVLLACTLAAPGWLALQAYPPAWLTADLRAGTGQWKTQVLDDGTRISINSGTAVNLRYDARRRALELVQGEILVEVAKDAARPFLVETRDGSMRALGTKFLVSREDGATRLSVLESRVSVQTDAQRRSGSRESIVVEAGHAVRIRPDGTDPIVAIDSGQIEAGWQQHRLFVHDRPLAEVLDTLARHRRGLIQYDAQAIAGMRISAVLPLDDTDRAMQLLAANLPGLRVRSFTPYLLRVDFAPAH
jgi:transmembrane sensor